MQPTLFPIEPANPLAHANDPPTSHEAARNHVRSGNWKRNADLVLDLVRARPGLTGIELWQAAGPELQATLKEPQEVRRRLNDLLKAEKVSQTEARLCIVRGTKQVTWTVTQPTEEPCPPPQNC